METAGIPRESGVNKYPRPPLLPTIWPRSLIARANSSGAALGEHRHMGNIILVTETPRFTDGGDFLRCELVSEGESWAFGISWHHTQFAMPACGQVLDAHNQRAREVVATLRSTAKGRMPAD